MQYISIVSNQFFGYPVCMPVHSELWLGRYEAWSEI